MALKTTRRMRSTATSTGQQIIPTPRDLEILLKLYEHGPLPSAYLFELTRHLGRDLTRLKKRVGDLFHEDNTPHGRPYLERPWQLNPRYDYAHFVVSDLSAAGERLLTEFELLRPEAKATAGGSSQHRFMTACITASFELAVRKCRGLRWISRGEIMSSSPHKTLSLTAPISYAFKSGVRQYDKPISSDAIFGIEYPAGRLYFLIETDLHNEPVRREDFNTTSYLRKALQYKEAIGSGRYRAHFGFEQSLVVLTFTTNEVHAENVRAMVLKELGDIRYLLFTSLPVFDGPLRVPGIIEDILGRPYARAGHSDFYLNRFG